MKSYIVAFTANAGVGRVLGRSYTDTTFLKQILVQADRGM